MSTVELKLDWQVTNTDKEAQMHTLKVLVIAFLANPTCTNWVKGLKSLGYDITVLDWKKSPATQSDFVNWGFEGSEFPIFHIWNDFSEELQQRVINSLGGTPDILFTWEGSPILKPLRMVKKSFPTAKVIHCVNTYPNAISELTELRLHWRYRNTSSLIDGYIFYSQVMRQLFVKNTPLADDKPYLVMVEPFFEKAFASNGVTDPTVPLLKRVDEHPHVIFIGRGSELWCKNFLYNGRWDALGSFFKELAKLNVHIFLPSQADTKNIPNLHRYPDFSNQDLFTGRFAEYISQFDANLVIYNEFNNVIRRRVSTGLSTRFASALTSTTPLAVTKTSQFVEEYWKDAPFGFSFSDVDDLAKSLHNKDMLASLRRNMEKVHQSYSFESQSRSVVQFLNEVLQPRISNQTISV